MKTKLSVLLAIGLTIVFQNSLYGAFAIITTNAPSGICNGQISITADGTAGPFEIQLTSNGNLTHSFLQVDGTITVDDLCAQDYQVSAINRFGCSHFLGEVLFDPSSDANVATEFSQEINGQSVQNPQVSVYPNPFSDGFEILFEGSQSGRVSITGYDNLGRVIFEKSNSYLKGKNRFGIKLETQAIADGLLIVEILDLSTGFRMHRKLIARRE